MLCGGGGQCAGLPGGLHRGGFFGVDPPREGSRSVEGAGMEGLTWENLRASVEFLSHLVTAIGLPYAVVVFVYEQRKERENEEEEAYQNLSNAYIEFLEVVLNHADLQLRTRAALPDPTPEQRERMAIIFDMLVSLFERAYLVAYKARMDERESAGAGKPGTTG